MIEPLGWRFVRGVLNLLAFDAGRGAGRSFQANRIIEAHVLETSVREPAATGDTEAYFAQADRMANRTARSGQAKTTEAWNSGPVPQPRTEAATSVWPHWRRPNGSR